MSDRTDIIKGYLPDRIASKEPFASWLKAEGAVTGQFYADIDDVLLQGDVDKATWGLKYWESGLGITTDESKSYDFRRSVVKAKMRGYGTTTIAMIKNVAASFSNGEVEVIDSPSTYSFSIKFVGTIGTPPNMDDLTAALDEIKPAHLGYTYIYIYNTHAVLSAFTHAHLAAYTHDQLRKEAIT